MTDVLRVWRGEGRHEITLSRPERLAATRSSPAGTAGSGAKSRGAEMTGLIDAG